MPNGIVCSVSLYSASESQDEFLQLKALQILAAFLRYLFPLTSLPSVFKPQLSAESTPLQLHVLQPVINSISGLLQSPSANRRDVAVQCLETLLPRAECRKAVWRDSTVVSGWGVSSVLREDKDIYKAWIVYVIFCRVSLVHKWVINLGSAFGYFHSIKKSQNKSTRVFI